MHCSKNEITKTTAKRSVFFFYQQKLLIAFMITQKNNLANPLESKSVAAEGKFHNVPLEFILLFHSMHHSWCLYLHLHIHNVDQAVT